MPTASKFKLAIALLALWAVPASAQAEVNEVRIVRQIGLGYLPLYVAQDRRLIEKHTAAAGLGEVKVTILPLGTSTAITSAVLAGDADFAGVGVPPFLIAWDKTRGSALDVRAVVALNEESIYLNTTNPAVKTVADFTDHDRIALPAPKVSLQAIVLAMAAERAFGPGNHDRLDPLVVPLSHADGLTVLLAGKTAVTAHLTSSPFQYQELADPRVHRVLASNDVTDGPATFSVLYTTGRFRAANPRLVKAVADAVAEAIELIKADPAQAAAIYARIDPQTMSLDRVRSLIANPDNSYSTVPHNIMKYADFMARTGLNRHRPDSWRDLFFAEGGEGDGS